MASRYKSLDFDSEEEREKDPTGPPRVNLVAAGSYMKRILDANGIQWAVMGGFSSGHPRRRHRNGRHHEHPVEDSKLVDGVIKVFVRTGPAYGDTTCEQNRIIEVDLVQPGAKGTPVKLSSHRALHQISFGGDIEEFYGLDLLYVMKTKLRHCTTRTMPRDLQDLLYLLDNYALEMPAIRDRLDEEDLEFFLNTETVKKMTHDKQAGYRTLLGC